MPGPDHIITCCACHEEFVTSDTLEDAKALYEKRFPGEKWEEGKMKVMCDECFESQRELARILGLGFK